MWLGPALPTLDASTLPQILRAYLGKDASKAFHGGMNNHTRAAANLARMYRVSRLDEEDPRRS